MTTKTRRGLSYVSKRVALSVVMSLLFFAILEGALRTIGFEYTPRQKELQKTTLSGFMGALEIYVPTKFVPPGYLYVSQPNTPFTDRYGFRKPEIPIEKQKGKIRVAFLGGSTTHSSAKPYPERAIHIINSAIGTDRYEMLNVACCGYSTHQSMMALDRWVLPRDPDIVMIYHGWNDTPRQLDGYSDHDKDLVLRVGPRERGKSAWNAARWLRTGKLVGRLLDAADTSWPRVRVPPRRFKKNMRTMIGKCAERGIPVVVMIRPEKEDVPVGYEKGLVADEYAQRHAVQRLQREIVDEFDNATACDGFSLVRELQQREQRGEFGDVIKIFRGKSHLQEFADQKLAELVAVTLTPENKQVIEKYLGSVDYHLYLAEDFLSEVLLVDEAIYHAREALALDPTPEQEKLLKTIITRAEDDREFAELFEAGRHEGGTEKDLEKKLAALKRCLEIKPQDYGVMLQVYRVCLYRGQLDLAADAMQGFKPTTARQQYEWLNYMFQSFAQGKRWENAHRCAQALLKMNPGHKDARAFVNAVRIQK